ncbi:MAG: hypothetical protein ACREYE_29040 [Gammaproteobacteria bacterium]
MVPPDDWDRDAKEHEDPDDEEEDDQGFGGGKRKRAFLKLNPNDNSLWLARHKSLYYYDREAHLLERIRLPKRAKALAVDPTRDEVWVGTKAGLHRYDTFGRPLDGVRPAPSHIRALAYEPDGDALWVADIETGAAPLCAFRWSPGARGGLAQ